ncbi:MAG: hypothetical protein VB115_08975 [Christensenellaceae bacterium]|nr:hypothetical protein [Christensenellaceae bacterium]
MYTNIYLDFSAILSEYVLTKEIEEGTPNENHPQRNRRKTQVAGSRPPSGTKRPGQVALHSQSARARSRSEHIRKTTNGRTAGVYVDFDETADTSAYGLRLGLSSL